MRGASSSRSETILTASISAIAGLFALLFICTLGVLVLLIVVPPVTTGGAGIEQIAVATICLYLVSTTFKLLTKRRAGYRENDLASGRHSQVSERMLFGVSFAVATAGVIYSAWWHHRLASREYWHSRLCYVQLQTAIHLPRFEASFAPGGIGYHARLSLTVAETHGAMLGMRQEAVDSDLAQAAAAYFHSYAGLTGVQAERANGALLNQIVRCVNDDWARHGEILNP